MPHPLFTLMRTLDRQRLWYVLDRLAPDSITLTVTIGEGRFEIDALEDGRIHYRHIPAGEAADRASQALEQALRHLDATTRSGSSPEP